ncbi:hypothetical protein ACP70R_009477 [Stipagrostis hirtigluma subsp. patula]
MEREAAAAGFAAESSPSRCSSGCQSGWTLYLDHSDGQRRCVPCEPAQWWMMPEAEPAEDDEDEEEEEDSMVSDASSGPAPPRRREEDDEEVLRRRDHELHLRQFFGHRCCSSSSAGGGSGCFGSTLPPSFHLQGEAKSRERTAVVAVHGEAAAYHVDGEDDLDDTASSSSAIFSHPTRYIASKESWTVARQRWC